MKLAKLAVYADAVMRAQKLQEKVSNRAAWVFGF